LNLFLPLYLGDACVDENELLVLIKKPDFFKKSGFWMVSGWFLDGFWVVSGWLLGGFWMGLGNT
jgi:hypothetical protein